MRNVTKKKPMVFKKTSSWDNRYRIMLNVNKVYLSILFTLLVSAFISGLFSEDIEVLLTLMTFFFTHFVGTLLYIVNIFFFGSYLVFSKAEKRQIFVASIMIIASVILLIYEIFKPLYFAVFF